jgi:hypothetical protein
MSLKCPFCGTEYFHDRKVCQKCEEESINNINIPKNYTYVHYEKTIAFGCRKPDEAYIKIDSEPKFSDFRLNGISQLKTIKEVSLMDLKIFEKEKNYSLIYE